MSIKSLLSVKSDKPESKEGIWPILNMAPSRIETIAPKKVAELLESISGPGEITVELKSSRDLESWANRETRTLGVSRGLGECLWCAAYAYLAYRIELKRQKEAQAQGGPISLKLAGPDITEANYTLKRALFCATRRELLGWRSLPVPVVPKDITDESSLEEQAGEMVLDALGFSFYNELAHIPLGHTASQGDAPWSLEQDKEADSEAIRWILREAPSEEAAQKRCWSIAIPLVFYTALRVERYLDTGPLAPKTPQSPPFPYDRMDNAIQHEDIQKSPLLTETLTSLACAALVPHVLQRNLPLEEAYDDYPSLYKACIDALTATSKK